MDLHVVGPLASPAEREAVDAVRPRIGRRGAAGRVASATWRSMATSRAAVTRRGPVATCSCRRSTRVQSRIGWISQPALELHLSAADGAAGGGLRRRDVLRAVRHDAPATGRRPCLRRHRLPARPAPRSCARRSSGRSDRAGAPALDGGTTWLRSPCLGPVRASPRRAVHDRRGNAAHRRRRADRRCRRRGPTRSAARRPDRGVQCAIRRAPRPAPDLGPAGRRSRAPTARPDRRRRPDQPRRLRANGGYRALARAFELGPQRVIDEVAASKLVGRGGAAFPTGRKWAAVATQPARPHYLVCNADESEPGTFKDRVLIEERPVRDRRGDDDRGVRDGRRTGLPVHPWRVPAGRGAGRQRDRPGPRGRAAGPGHPRLRVQLRHRAPARRRRLHLRRGDRAVRVDRGQARRAPQQAAVPGRGRPVRQADDGQQRRDARQHPADRRSTAARPSRRSAPRDPPDRSCSACPAHVVRPGVYEVAVRDDPA